MGQGWPLRFEVVEDDDVVTEVEAALRHAGADVSRRGSELVVVAPCIGPLSARAFARAVLLECDSWQSHLLPRDVHRPAATAGLPAR